MRVKRASQEAVIQQQEEQNKDARERETAADAVASLDFAGRVIEGRLVLRRQ